MAQIEFHEEVGSANRVPVSRASMLSRLFIGMGLAKDERGAKVAMVITMIACAACAAAVLVFSQGEDLPVSEERIREALPPNVR